MENNKPPKPSLAKMTYTRSYAAARTIPICLVGKSKWLEGIDLLMEDGWKQIYRPLDMQDLIRHIGQTASHLFVVEKGAYDESEMRLIETTLPKSAKKLIITHDTSNQIAWKALQRYACARNIPTLELPVDPKAAMEDLTEVLEGMIGLGTLNYSDDFDIVHKAYLGYGLVNQEPVPEFLPLFRHLLSKFTLNHDELSAALLLAETYAQWRAPKEAHSDLHLAYLRLEASLQGKASLRLLELARAAVEKFKTTSGLAEDGWKELVVKAGLGKLVERQLIRSLPEVRDALLKTSSRRLKVA